MRRLFWMIVGAGLGLFGYRKAQQKVAQLRQDYAPVAVAERALRKTSAESKKLSGHFFSAFKGVKSDFSQAYEQRLSELQESIIDSDNNNHE